MSITIPSPVVVAVLVAFGWFVVGTLASNFIWMPAALKVWGRNSHGGAPWPWMFRVGYLLGGPVIWVLVAWEATEDYRAQRRRKAVIQWLRR